MVKLREPYLVVGSKGMLGTDLVRLLQESGTRTVALDIDEMDICMPDSGDGCLRKVSAGGGHQCGRIY